MCQQLSPLNTNLTRKRKIPSTKLGRLRQTIKGIHLNQYRSAASIAYGRLALACLRPGRPVLLWRFISRPGYNRVMLHHPHLAPSPQFKTSVCTSSLTTVLALVEPVTGLRPKTRCGLFLYCRQRQCRHTKLCSPSPKSSGVARGSPAISPHRPTSIPASRPAAIVVSIRRSTAGETNRIPPPPFVLPVGG